METRTNSLSISEPGEQVAAPGELENELKEPLDLEIGTVNEELSAYVTSDDSLPDPELLEMLQELFRDLG